MGLIIISFLLLLSLCLGGKSCKFEAFKPTTVEEVVKCYEEIRDENGEVVRKTVDNVRKYLDLNVFLDYYFDTARSGLDRPIDLDEEVKNIGDKYSEERTGEKNPIEYYFHWDMVQLMLSLKDPHSVYRFPTCFTRIYYLLPFAINSGINSEDQQYLYLTSLPPDYSFATLYYQKNENNLFEGVDELIRAANEEMEIQEIEIIYDRDHYGEDVTDLKGAALDVLKQWADRHVYISRNSGARFNSALRSDFFLHASDYGIPFYNVRMKIRGIWYDVPWLAIPSQTIGGVDDLLSISPLNNDSSNNSVKAKNESSADFIRNLKRLAEKRMVEEIMEKPPGPKTLSVNTNNDSTHTMGSETRHGFLVKDDSNSESQEDSTLERIYIGDNISLYLYNLFEGDTENVTSIFKAYVISIPSFSPSVYEQFVEDLQEILNYIYGNQDPDNTTIIIDVRENGGGYVDLGNKLLYYLVEPEVDSNSSGFYMRRKCDLNDFLADNGYMSVIDGDDGLYDYFSHSILDPDDYYKSGEEYIETFHEEEEIRYMSGYTFSPLDFYDYSGQRRSDRGDTYNSNLGLKYYFDVNQSKFDTDATKFSVLVITDGTCGSTCATFLNHAIEVNAVTVIGVGGYYNNGPDGNDFLAASSFSGGSVLDSNTFESLFDYLGVSSADGDFIPEKMPRDNYIRFPYNALMSFRDNTVALEFEQMPVSMSVPYYPPSNLSVTNSIEQMLDFVIPKIYVKDGNSPANNEYNYISISDGCGADEIENSRVGRFYNRILGDFNENCEAVGCVSGFYPVYEDQPEIPLMEMKITRCVQLKETTTPTGDLGWVAILSIVLAVLVCIAVLVFWIIRKKQGKKFGDTGITRKCCCPCCFKGEKKSLESDEIVEDPLEQVEITSTSSTLSRESSSKKLLKEDS